MKITKNELEKFATKLTPKFFRELDVIYGEDASEFNVEDILLYMFYFSEITPKDKQFIYFKIMKNHKINYLEKLYLNSFKLIRCGKRIYNSFYATNSDLLINSIGIVESIGCKNCKFSKNLFYCTNQINKENMAFNKEVSEDRFKELINMPLKDLKKAPEFDQKIYMQLNKLINFVYR